jgi:hypothetical protein
MRSGILPSPPRVQLPEKEGGNMIETVVRERDLVAADVAPGRRDQQPVLGLAR